MAYFPLFIELRGRKCLIVGGGRVALRKAQVLSEFGADVEVAAQRVCREIKILAQKTSEGESGGISYREKTFDEADLKGKFLVVAATDDARLNHMVSCCCRERGIFVNAVDQMEDCDFIFPSYIKEGEVIGAFVSGGKSPVISQYLKSCTGKYLTPFLGEMADFLGGIRPWIKTQVQGQKNRKEVYRGLLSSGLGSGRVPERSEIEKQIDSINKMTEKRGSKEWTE